MDVSRKLCEITDIILPRGSPDIDYPSFSIEEKEHIKEITLGKENFSLVAGSYKKAIPKENDDFHMRIGHSIFGSISAIILANIHTLFDIFNITDLTAGIVPGVDQLQGIIHGGLTSEIPSGGIEFQNYIQNYGGSWAPQNMAVNKRFPISLHIYPSDSGFLEYIQYKYPLSYNYIIDPTDTSNPIKTDRLNKSNFESIRLNPKVGDTYISVIEKIRNSNGDGIDIILFDNEPDDTNLLSLFLITFNLLKIHGNFIFKINCSDNRYLSYLGIIPYLFNTVNLFKPSSINIFDAYLYVICFDFKGTNDNVIKHLQFGINNLSPGNLVNTLFPDSYNIKNYIMNTLRGVVSTRADVSNNHPKYFPQRCLIYWGLPGTPEI